MELSLVIHTRSCSQLVLTWSLTRYTISELEEILEILLLFSFSVDDVSLVCESVTRTKTSKMYVSSITCWEHRRWNGDRRRRRKNEITEMSADRRNLELLRVKWNQIGSGKQGEKRKKKLIVSTGIHFFVNFKLQHSQPTSKFHILYFTLNESVM